MLDSLRQGLFPKEYRIHARPLTADLSVIKGAITVLRTLASGLEKAPAPAPGDEPEDSGRNRREKDLAQLCTSLWRSRKTLTGSESPGTDDAYRRPLRHLNSAIEAAASLGLEIRDHTGEELPDSGAVSLRTISFELKEGLTHEVVLETLRPSVFLDGKCIQMGEIIVGSPKTPTGAEEAHE